MMDLVFTLLTEPTTAIAEAFTRWDNDPQIKHLSRPHRTAEELAAHREVTVEDLRQRISQQRLYLMRLAGQVIGEMSYQIDPPYLFKAETGTAWIGITIGEASGRGRGVGRQALTFLEGEIAAQGLTRIELGVFAFNAPALALYQKLGYREIGRVENFTYWQGQLWADIRMEKFLAGGG